ncbi:MAG: family 43 glycosylhydrolase [Clostridiales bacterium]|nr:family 43 glycosylhydrolase [Clostridiales bacterium]
MQKKAVALICALLMVVSAALCAAYAAPGGRATNATFYNNAAFRGADPHVLYDESSGYYYAYSTDGAPNGFRFAVYRSADLATWARTGGAIPNNDPNAWANDWFWAPECYYNENNGYYYLFYAGRMTNSEDRLAHFGFADFEEACKTGVAVSQSPEGPFYNIASAPIDYFPYDPDYYDVNQIMGDQKVPPATLADGEMAPVGVYLPFIDPNVFFDDNGDIYLYYSRNAYRNWVWDTDLEKYVEESNIYAVKLTTDWWNTDGTPVMPTIDPSYINANAGPGGGLGARKDGFVPVISYKNEPQAWENAHVDDYATTGGNNKNRRWAEGSTTMKLAYELGGQSYSKYYMVYSCNNYQNEWYGEGYAVADGPLGPWKKYEGNPIVEKDDSGEVKIYSTGHGSFVQSPDGSELFHVYHGRPSNAGNRFLYTNRAVLDTEQLDNDGNPVLRVEQIMSDQPMPSGVAPYSIEINETPSGDEAIDVTFTVRNAAGGALELENSANRVSVESSDESAASFAPSGNSGGTVTLLSDAPVTVTFAYQRLSIGGEYFDVYNGNDSEAAVAYVMALNQPTVTGVDISPSAAALAAGAEQQFSASVAGENDPPQSVEWSVYGNADAATSITPTGNLAIGADETATELTVRATSKLPGYTDVYGEAAVTVLQPPAPERFALTIAAAAGGAIAEGADGSYAAGDFIAIAAAADSGYIFAGWTTSGEGIFADASSASTMFTMPAAAASIMANFTEDTPTVPPAAAAPIFIADLPESVQIDAGAGLALGVEAVSPDGGTISYQWFKDGMPIAGEIGQSLYISGAAAGDAGHYHAVATNSNSSGSTAQAVSGVTAVTVGGSGNADNSSSNSGGGGGNSVGGSASSSIEPNTAPEPTPTPSPSPEPEDGQPAAPSPTPAPTGRPGQADGTRTVTGSVSGDEISGATHSYQIDVTSGAVQVSPDGAVLVDQGATADIAIAGGGAVVKAPGGTVVSPDGRIAIPVGSGGALVALQDGSSMSVPQGNVIFEDGATPLGFAYAYENPFIDVAGAEWFYDAVKFVVENALFNGTYSNMFSPGGSMTRAMMVTVLYRMEGQAGVSAPSTFEDVPAGEWYSDAIAWGVENGIVNGLSDISFGGGEPVAREQLAAILLRYAEYKGKEASGGADVSAFADAASVSGYALEAVQWAVGAGLIQGRGENDIAPQGNATRAEVASIIQRFMAIG